MPRATLWRLSTRQVTEHKPSSSDEQRSALELRKLAAEVAVVERPWWKHAPGTVTILLSALAISIQYCSSDRAYDLAKIERAQAQLDIAHLGVERQKAESVLAQALTTTAAVHSLRAAEEQRLASARRAVALAESALLSLPRSTRPSTAAASKALASAASGLREASGAHAREVQAYERRIAQLQAEMAKVAVLDTVPSWILIGRRQRGPGNFYDPPFGQAMPRIGANLCVSYRTESYVYKYTRLPALAENGTAPTAPVRGQYPRYSVMLVMALDSATFPRRPTDDAESWSSWVFARVKEVGRGDIDSHCGPTPPIGD
jgi:hypothetical protein